MKIDTSLLNIFCTLVKLITVFFVSIAIANDQTEQASDGLASKSFLSPLNFYSSYSNYSGHYETVNLDSNSIPTLSTNKYTTHFFYFLLSYKLTPEYKLKLSTSYSDTNSFFSSENSNVVTTTHTHSKGFLDPELGLSYGKGTSESEKIEITVKASPALGSKKTNTIGNNEKRL